MTYIQFSAPLVDVIDPGEGSWGSAVIAAVIGGGLATLGLLGTGAICLWRYLTRRPGEGQESTNNNRGERGRGDGSSTGSRLRLSRRMWASWPVRRSLSPEFQEMSSEESEVEDQSGSLFSQEV